MYAVGLKMSSCIGMFPIIGGEEEETVTPVTDGMTLDATWDDKSTPYTDLENATVVSCKCTVDISPGDEGIIMESGAGGKGLVLYTYDGTLYFSCGSGGSATSTASTAVVSTTMPTGTGLIIEWSASADTDTAALYVDGVLVGTDSFNDSNVTGFDQGGIGKAHGAVATTVPGWTAVQGEFTGTVTSAEIFIGEVTSDVA